MNIPNVMPETMAQYFYDKTVTYYETANETDAEGQIYAGIYVETPNGTFLGNVQFNALKRLIETYGFKDDIEVAITCLKDTPIDQDFVLEYGGVLYRVTDVKELDAYKLIVGVKWQSLKYLTLISA
jgi:hypothetical protein